MTEAALERLERRLGGLHARQRLGIETDHEAQIFGQGINFFHIENWYSIHAVIRTTLKLLGLYKRGLKNAEQIQVRHNQVCSKLLPNHFDGFTLLQISDLHADISEGAMRRLNEILPGMTYDMCVLTGDYRGATFGPFDTALAGLALARTHLKGPIYAVLGNHDSILMLVPQVDVDGNEVSGIRLPNVAVPLATYTGWTFRSPSIGQPEELLPLTGSFVPFPVTKAARDESADPRVSIEERYGNRAVYQELVTAAATKLAQEGYLLNEDVAPVVERALTNWDEVTRGTRLAVQ